MRTAGSTAACGSPASTSRTANMTWRMHYRTLGASLMRTRSRWFGALRTIALIVALGGVALAQRDGFGGGPFTEGPNIPYDGKFTFARIRYQTAPGGFWAGGRPSWIHGYPLSERNLMMIMNEVSLLGAHVNETNTFTFDDPEL